MFWILSKRLYTVLSQNFESDKCIYFYLFPAPSSYRLIFGSLPTEILP